MKLCQKLLYDKAAFAAFMEAICFNLRRLTVLGPPGVIFI
jgi:hypothetical protein